MKAVYKYEIGSGVAPLRLPQGAKFLHAEGIDGDYYVWAEIDKAKPDVVAYIGVMLTGIELPNRELLLRGGVIPHHNGPVHVDSFTMPDSDDSTFVGHVYHFGYAKREDFS